MVASGLIILGLVVGEPGKATSGQVAAIEVPFSTGVGEVVFGVKRFFRSGCYEVVSEGGSAAPKPRDSQVGCHLPGEVSEAFQRIDLLAAASGGAIVKEGRTPASTGRGNESGTPAQARAVIVRGDGSRGVAANEDVAGELLSAINAIPAENQWHAKPPTPAIGKGPQFVAISVSATGEGSARKFQASLSADGRWWCRRQAGGVGGDAPAPRGQRLQGVGVREASARLGRILQGAKPKSAMDDDNDESEAGGVETSVELIFAGRPRSSLFPKRLAKTAAKRFATEMTRHSHLCALP